MSTFFFTSVGGISGTTPPLITQIQLNKTRISDTIRNITDYLCSLIQTEMVQYCDSGVQKEKRVNAWGSNPLPQESAMLDDDTGKEHLDDVGYRS